MNVGVIGASGFTGEKLVELLLNRPDCTITYLSAKIDEEMPFSQLFPRFKSKMDLVCKNLNVAQAAGVCDILFLALPHRISFAIAPFFLKKKKTMYSAARLGR